MLSGKQKYPETNKHFLKYVQVETCEEFVENDNFKENVLQIINIINAFKTSIRKVN